MSGGLSLSRIIWALLKVFQNKGFRGQFLARGINEPPYSTTIRHGAKNGFTAIPVVS
jgi:hypothetical protein